METFRILILGSTSWTDCSHDIGSISADGIPHSAAFLPRFLAAADSRLLSLETPLTQASQEASAVGAALNRMGIDAVNLASDRVFDHGAAGLEATIQALSERGIGWFGAGRTAAEAEAPHRIQLPDRIGGGQVHLHGSLQYSADLHRQRGVFAGDHSPGCAPLKASSVPASRSASAPEDSFHVALPHWGGADSWRSHMQFKLAHRFLKKEYDLVLGNGSERAQEIVRKQQRWVVYGLGDGPSRSGRKSLWDGHNNDAVPYSFWAMMEVHRQQARRWVTLKLYPVKLTDTAGDTQWRPVSSAEFDHLTQTLASRPVRPWRFANPSQGTGTDQLGHFLELSLGEWVMDQRPSRLEPTTRDGDPGEWPLRSPGAAIEDRVLRLRKHLAVTLLSSQAEAAGGTATWLAPDLALLEVDDRSMLAFRYSAHESALGSAVVDDKVLTAEVLESAGVPTPKTVLVHSAEEAVRAAESITGPVVIKPRDGIQSKGVSTGLVGAEEIREGFAFAQENGSQVILQPHIEMSEELRVMASPDQTVAINGRVLPHIIGDGISTVQQLITDKNLQRTLNPSLNERPIPVDALTIRQLERSGLTLDSVPPLGVSATVRNVAGLSVGGDTNQVLEGSGPEIKRVATSAVAAVPSLGWGGVDVIVEKGTGNLYVIEINAKAAYGAALFPAYGRPRDVGAAVWKLRYAATAPNPESVPEVAQPNPAPTPLLPRELAKGRSKVLFRRLFSNSLVRQNYSIEEKSPGVLGISAPQGWEAWVTRGGLTGADRSVVQRVLQRHELVCHLLRLRDIPRTRRRRVTTVEQLRHWAKDLDEDVLLIPSLSSWRGIDVHVVPAQRARSMTSMKGRMWVQVRPRGVRVRVLATQHKSWGVTAAATEKSLNAVAIASASEVAIRAVRAVPELRWAAVDVVFSGPSAKSTSKPPLVEGMSMSPTFTAEDQVIAGSFDEFCRWVVEPSSEL
ncbi:MAG: CapA family protein [Nesterenkonia sp.]